MQIIRVQFPILLIVTLLNGICFCAEWDNDVANVLFDNSIIKVSDGRKTNVNDYVLPYPLKASDLNNAAQGSRVEWKAPHDLPANVIIPREFTSDETAESATDPPDLGLEGYENGNSRTEMDSPKTETLFSSLLNPILERLGRLASGDAVPFDAGLWALSGPTVFGSEPISGLAQTASRWSNIAAENMVNGANFWNNLNHRAIDRVVDVLSIADRSGRNLLNTDLALMNHLGDNNLKVLDVLGSINDRFVSVGNQLLADAVDQLSTLATAGGILSGR